MSRLTISTPQKPRHFLVSYPLYKWRAFACCAALLLLWPCRQAVAKEIFVNNITGMDTHSGLSATQPLKTIARAVRMVQPGDILHIINTGVDYRESLPLVNIRGTAAAPIVIDGHGAVLSGAEPIQANHWQQVRPGLYRDTSFYTANRFVPDYLRIYYFLFNDSMVRMGRSRKGPNTPFKLPDALQEKEWTFVEGEKAFYLRIDPAKTLADHQIRQPVRSNGVGVVGNTEFVTVQNLVVQNFYNDGFGLTSGPAGFPKNIRFINIQSRYCGDDGISAHEQSQVEVEGFISIGNATGICDAGNSVTSYNGVFIKDCVGMDICFMNEKPGGTGVHSLKNAEVIGNGYRPVVLTAQQPGATLTVTMENVVIKPCTVMDPLRYNEIHIAGKGEHLVSMKDCTFAGLALAGTAKPVSMQNTIIGGQ